MGKHEDLSLPFPELVLRLMLGSAGTVATSFATTHPTDSGGSEPWRTGYQIDTAGITDHHVRQQTTFRLWSWELDSFSDQRHPGIKWEMWHRPVVGNRNLR